MFKLSFYKINEPYGCFSNFASFPIELDGKVWPTTEHYFQAQKFVGTVHEEALRLALTPMEAAIMGRDRNRPLRRDWEYCKDEIMRKAVRTKIEQHQEVKDILISTGNCVLVEHTTYDAYWADNGDGTGKNMLGKILMEIRNGLDGYTGEFFLPQWIKFPDVHPIDTFWRMGAGEDYVMKLAQWYYSLSIPAQNEYDRYFAPPKEWEMILS